MQNENNSKKHIRVKSPLRLIVAVLLLCTLIYAGIAGAVSIVTGQPVKFAFWSCGNDNTRVVQDFVVAGVDEDGYRTDLILLCRYNLSDDSLKILQIPRDTKVENQRSDKKINSAYGSPEKTEALFDEIEIVTGIRPQRYVIVSFKAFRELIDVIGGVEVDVPMRMYYTDPYQDLTIDLYPGTQVLDGKKAEMFMRFRKNNDGTGYPNGDIDRMAAQRQFYDAVKDKLLSGSTVLKAPQILGIINENVETDFNGDDIVRYIGRIPKFKTENIKIMSLPGEGGYANGISYFFYDETATKELIEQEFIIKDSSDEDEKTDKENTDEL